MDNLDEEVTRCRDVLGLHPPGHPDRSSSLHDLSYALWSRFEQTGETNDLDESIACDRDALLLRPSGHASRPDSLESLAVSLATRFEQNGRTEDLEESIKLLRSALDLRPPGHPLRSMSLMNLANAVKTRFQQNGRTEDLEESIKLHRSALDLLPPGHPHRSMSLGNLANAVNTRFEQNGRMEDLEESIELHRSALDLRPTGHPLRSSSLMSLANAVKTRFQQNGRTEDLEESIKLHRSALDLRPPGHPLRSMSLMNLANAVKTRFQQNGRTEDLEESIKLYRTALDLLPPGHPHRSGSLMNLANAVKTRFKQNGRMADLEESIKLHRSALDLRPPGHPNRSSSLMNLANAVFTRFEQNGRTEDLEESIKLHRSALDLLPTGYPNRSSSLMNLANAVFTRFEQNGRTEDLKESIKLHRSALDLLPTGHPHRSSSLMNLANAVETRFEKDGRMEDLEESIKLQRSALDLRPPGHPDRSSSLISLSSALWTQFQQNGRTEDLEESIKLHRSALDLLPPGHPLRSMSLMNLANAVETRFQQNGRTEDLEESIELHRSALDLRPTGHPLRSRSLMSLSNALCTRFQQVYHEKDLEEAFELLQSGAHHEFSSSLTRLRSACQWANLARSYNHPTTLGAYSTALLLLERSLNVVPTVSMQHELLNGRNGYPTLAVDAASYAIEKRDLARAVEFLEQGRALLWSQMRGFRMSIDRLAEVNKELADNFKDVSNEFEALATGTSPETRIPGSSVADGLADNLRKGPLSFDELVTRSRRLSEDRKKIIGKIQELPGFEDFQRPTRFTTLRDAAVEGPIIVVNHSSYRSDAIIVTNDHGPVLVPLSESVPEFFETTFDVYRRLTDARRDLSSLPKNYSEILRFVMEKLWMLIVSKVVEKLKEIGFPEQSRIWWCPTSILQALPLHAAGIWSKDDRGITGYRSHKYISSYTPTLQALIQARSNISLDSARVPPFLVVGQPDDNLQNVGHEIDLIDSSGRSMTRLVGEQATSSEVIRNLKEHPWVHFACHGELVRGRPFDSSFRLFGDDRLSLLEIVRARLPNAEVAFLAACHTAEQTINSAHDEVLHLAAGVQFCGFRSVIGTMWAMLDEDGPVLAQKFYTHISAEDGTPEAGFKKSARALYKATREMRKKKVALESWVNFVHIGA